MVVPPAQSGRRSARAAFPWDRRIRPASSASAAGSTARAALIVRRPRAGGSLIAHVAIRTIPAGAPSSPSTSTIFSEIFNAGEGAFDRFSILPINVDDLLRGRPVESARIEFKAGWNPDTTGFQVLKTVCAFANDLQSLNGGYVVIGVAESEGRAVRPVVAGLSGAEIDAAQRWIRGRCKAMQPGYAPILSPSPWPIFQLSGRPGRPKARAPTVRRRRTILGPPASWA